MNNQTLRLMTGVVNATNIRIQGVMVHVETEVHMKCEKIVTSVSHQGRIVYQRDRSFAQHTTLPNLGDLLVRGARAHHNQILQQLQIIWAKLPSDVLTWISQAEADKTEQPLPVDKELRAIELFELGLAALRNEPEKALDLWKEALAMNPRLKQCQANIHRLEQRLAS
jgi:hypothetical protein